MFKYHQECQTKLFFKKFSRKTFAAFNSLGKIVKISTLGAACSIIMSPVQGQSKQDSDSISKKLDLEEVEVVGQKTSVLIDEVPRMVEMINSETIKSSPSQSVQDFIQFHSNIDIRQRGQLGVQSDISIRGGSFDQVLVLLNGINISDPQTGHHSLNLPFDLESISRIEILNGPSARANGANAFSGAVNFITKPLPTNEIKASVHGGEYGYLKGFLGVNIAKKNSQHALSSSFSKSDGYKYNTDFKSYNLFYHGNYQLEKHTSFYTQLGFNQKAFGSNGFYLANYPDNYEETSSILLLAGLKSGTTNKIKVDVFWRRHKDMFQLTREGDDYYRYEENLIVNNNTLNNVFISNDTLRTAYDTVKFRYVNHHITDIFGINTNINIQNKLGTTSLGFNLRSDNIISNSLGKELPLPIKVKGTDNDYYTNGENRINFNLFTEHVYKSDAVFISAGILANWNNFEPQKLNFIPGIDASYKLIPDINIIGSYNYTAGQPSFTDLFYQDTTNKGNNLLKPYYQHSVEGGLKVKKKLFAVKAVAFYTNGKDNVEWVLNDVTHKFTPINVKLSENLGAEISINYKSDFKNILDRLISQVYIGYTHIDTYRNTADSTSRYSNIREKLVVNLKENLIKNATLSWNFMYKERVGNTIGYDFTNGEYTLKPYPSILLIDVRGSYNIDNFSIYAECSNILDLKYYESGSAAQPGRWFKGGISYRFKW